MSGRIYNVVVPGIAVTAAQDLVAVVAPADACVIIRALEIGQSSDAGDAEDEQLLVDIITGHATTGSGGSAVTPPPVQSGSPAFGGTARRNDTTIASAGTPLTHRSAAFNARAGYVWQPDNEGMVVLPPSARLVVRLMVAPADSLTLSATLTIEELG